MGFLDKFRKKKKDEDDESERESGDEGGNGREKKMSKEEKKKQEKEEKEREKERREQEKKEKKKKKKEEKKGKQKKAEKGTDDGTRSDGRKSADNTEAGSTRADDDDRRSVGSRGSRGNMPPPPSPASKLGMSVLRAAGRGVKGGSLPPTPTRGGRGLPSSPGGDSQLAPPRGSNLSFASQVLSAASKDLPPGGSGRGQRPPGTPLPPSLRPAGRGALTIGVGRGGGSIGGSPVPSPLGRGRGRGERLSNAPSVASHSGSNIINNLMSTSSPRSIIGDQWSTGRKVFIKEVGPTGPDQKARGTIVQPQGDSIIVQCDPVWEETHPRGPYSKQRLRLLPPIGTHVEVRGHSNQRLNGRTGVVVEYDNRQDAGYTAKPDALRVLLDATEDAPSSRVLLNFAQLKPRQAPPPQAQSPISTSLRSAQDPASKLINSLRGDRDSVPKDELAGAIRRLAPQEAAALKVDADTLAAKVEGWRGDVVTPAQFVDMLAAMAKAPEAATADMQGPSSPTIEVTPAPGGSPRKPPTQSPGLGMAGKAEHQRVPSAFSEISEMSDQGTVVQRPGAGTPLREPRLSFEDVERRQEEERKREARERDLARMAKELEERNAALKKEEAARKAEEEERRESLLQEVQAKRKQEHDVQVRSLVDQEVASRSLIEEAEESGRGGVAQRMDDSLRFMKAYTTNMGQAMSVMEQLKSEIAALKERPSTPRAGPAAGPAGPGPAAPATPTASAAQVQVAATSPRTAAALWEQFRNALAANGADIDDISHATDEQLLTLLTDTLKFSQLDALRIANLWPDRKPSGKTAKPPARSRSRSAQRASSKRGGDMSDSAASDAGEAWGETASQSDQQSSTAPRTAGRRVILPTHAQEYIMVSEVLKHTTTSGDLAVKVTRIVQLIPSPSMLKRYERSKKHLEAGHQAPKVLYYSGPTMPSVSEVLQRGFHDELRRSRCLQFSTEANVETASKSGNSEIVMLLLCEVLAGRVRRLPQGSLASVQRQVSKCCGPPNPPKGKTYPADSVGMEYTYTDRRGEAKTATRYALTDPDRVIPRYLVYLSVTPTGTPAAGIALASPQRGMSPSMLLAQPLMSPRSTNPRSLDAVQPVTPAAASPRTALNPLLSVGDLGLTASMPLPASDVVMCPLHPKEELRLYCVDEQELTCSMCASVGRHAGKKCQPLGDLLQSMKPHLAVHEKQIASRLSHLESSMFQLQKQADRMKESELRARREIRRRTTELLEEVNARGEFMEQDLTVRASDTGVKLQECLRRSMERTVMLKQAHEKVGSLVGSMAAGKAGAGVSAKATDIIMLSKLLEQLKHDETDDIAEAERLSLVLTDDVHTELARMRLPPPSVSTPTSRPYRLGSPATAVHM